MDGQGGSNEAPQGKTYSLNRGSTGTDRYYSTVRELVDSFLQIHPDEHGLLFHVQRAGVKRSFLKKPSERALDRSLISFMKKTIRDRLSVYTGGVKSHLRTLPLSQRFDKTLSTKEEQYHLYMLEIELVNRIYRESFRKSAFKFALIAHCLRDFRPDCRSVAGDIESVCKGCTEDCFINLGSHMLKKYGIHPYISVTMDLEKLFKRIKTEHKSAGALGIACIPELAQGMRLCIKLGIPPVGVPLDANRCSRWMKECQESSFDLKELSALLN
jgi:hypothetical protein